MHKGSKINGVLANLLSWGESSLASPVPALPHGCTFPCLHVHSPTSTPPRLQVPTGTLVSVSSVPEYLLLANAIKEAPPWVVIPSFVRAGV